MFVKLGKYVHIFIEKKYSVKCRNTLHISGNRDQNLRVDSTRTKKNGQKIPVSGTHAFRPVSARAHMNFQK